MVKGVFSFCLCPKWNLSLCDNNERFAFYSASLRWGALFIFIKGVLMKKNLSLLFTTFIICTLVFAVTSCSFGNYEDKLLGQWGCHSGGKSIIYEFEKNDQGDYTATCGTSNGIGSPQIYMFDEFSASSSVITFKQGGKQTKHNYSFEDDYLYIDGLEFEKID